MIVLRQVSFDAYIPISGYIWDGLPVRRIPSPPTEVLAAPTLRELHLSGTDEAPLRVSSGALMQLVAERKKEAEGYWWPLDPHGPLPMHTIMVRNAGSELKPGQKEWFDERLEGFSWGVISALRSPVLDGDCATWDFSEVRVPFVGWDAKTDVAAV